MACRNCKHYDLDQVKDKAGRVRKDRMAQCLWVMPDILPDSITRRTSFGILNARYYMCPDDGIDCPAFEANS